jgi:hypothetical protein
MKRLLVLLVSLSPVTALAQQPAPMETSKQMVHLTSTVEKVDKSKREVTLKGADGNPVIMQVPESVRRLDNVRAGDQVSIDYYQSAAISMKKPEAKPAAPHVETVMTRSPGKLPGGMVGQEITGTAKINKIDMAKNMVTIEGPQGQLDTINVTDPAMRDDMKKLKAGDALQVTYSQAMAVSMTPAPKP